MKVFISWSGQRSKAVAELLRETLPSIIQVVKPFMSKHDITSGEPWGKRIAKELDDTSFGIFCLTPENVEAPWLHYEAGAISKLEGRVAGLLIADLKPTDFNNPLSQFQHRVFSQADFRQLISDICATASADTLAITKVFDLMWPQLEAKYNEIVASQPQQSIQPQRTNTELLEEILLRQRSLEKITSELSRSIPPYIEALTAIPSPSLWEHTSGDISSRRLEEFALILTLRTRAENNSLSLNHLKLMLSYTIPDVELRLLSVDTYEMYNDLDIEIKIPVAPRSEEGKAKLLRAVLDGIVSLHQKP
jgi:hypothetical protein